MSSTNQSAVEIMVEMGFSRSISEKALKTTGYASINAAIEYILSNNLNNESNSTSNKPSSSSSAAASTMAASSVALPINSDFSLLKSMWYSQSIAILIACEEYPNIKHLKGAVSSVKRLANILNATMGFDQVHLLLNEQVTNANILELLRSSLKSSDEKTRVLITLVGHAKVEKTRKAEQEYFCCYHYDAQEDLPSNKVKNALYFRDLLTIVEEHCYAKHVLFLFDCYYPQKLLGRKQKVLQSDKYQFKQLKRAMEDECRFVFKSGAPDESIDERENASSMIKHLCDALITPWFTGNSYGFCTFYELAKYVKSLCQNETYRPKYGFLNESKGHILFKLPTEVEIKDIQNNQVMYKMRDSGEWFDIHEYWPDGLYLCCWNNGLPERAVDLGWIRCNSDKLYTLHSLVAHKSANKVVIYEFGMYDSCSQTPKSEGFNAEKLALGINGCVVATEWTITGKLLSNPRKLFCLPSMCEGFVTDLSSNKNSRKWIRVASQDASDNVSIQKFAEKAFEFSENAHNDEDTNTSSCSKWNGYEIYKLNSNNCHHYSYGLLCCLLEKELRWLFQDFE
jgi:hypothetical protein